MLFQIWASFSFHIQYSKYGYVCTKYVITVSTDLLPTASTYNSNILSALSLLIVMKAIKKHHVCMKYTIKPNARKIYWMLIT